MQRPAQKSERVGGIGRLQSGEVRGEFLGQFAGSGFDEFLERCETLSEIGR